MRTVYTRSITMVLCPARTPTQDIVELEACTVLVCTITADVVIATLV